MRFIGRFYKHLILLMLTSIMISCNEDRVGNHFRREEYATVIKKAKRIFEDQRFDYSIIQVRSASNPIWVSFEPV